MKPIELKELEGALAKFESLRPASPAVDINKIASAFLRRSAARLLVKINNQFIYIKSQDIAYIKVLESTPYVYTFSGQKFPLDYTLDHIGTLLDPLNFFRINRQFMISIDSIQKISSYFNSRLILKLEPDSTENVIVSREKVNSFKDWLEGKVT
jgi:DNA-binding LytR/AlgR family response regulator